MRSRLNRFMTRGIFPALLVLASGPAAAQESPGPSDVRDVLADHGVLPELLCVSGLTATQTTTFLGHCADVLEDRWDTVEPARDRLSTATSALVAARVAAAADAGAAESYTLAQQEFAAAKAAWEAVCASLSTGFMSGLSPTTAAELAVLVANQHNGLPLEYRALTLEEADRLALRDALAAVRTVEEEAQPPAGTTQLVWTYDAEPAVAMARSRLSLLSADVHAAYAAFFTGLQEP